MCDQWMPALKLAISVEQFHQLPRNPAYKYEYARGHAYLTPRAKFYHCRLDLERHAPPPDVVAAEPFETQQIADADFDDLTLLFEAAFARVQPFAGLDEKTMAEAARQCLERTRTGGDGPWLRAASLVSRSASGQVLAASLVTLMPEGDPRDYTSYYWKEEAPADLIDRRAGRPHLTWIFVHPFHAAHGLGSGLLACVAAELRRLGYRELLSTFVLGNDSSTLWHWRNGFELLSYPLSQRRRVLG